MGIGPDLMSLLGGAGGGAPPMGSPMEEEPAAPEGGGGGDNVQYLQAALEELQGYIQGEDDEINKQTALQCLAKLQSILAGEQKEQDDMLQGKFSPASLRRATGGQGSSGQAY